MAAWVALSRPRCGWFGCRGSPPRADPARGGNDLTAPIISVIEGAAFSLLAPLCRCMTGLLYDTFSRPPFVPGCVVCVVRL